MTETRFCRIGIDPGSTSGALAVYKNGDVYPRALRIPETLTGQWSWASDLVKAEQSPGSRVEIICEDVGASMPGNAARSSNTFAQHVGGLKMLVAVLCALYMIPSVVWLRPVAWMDGVLGPNRPKGRDQESKKLRKHMVKSVVEKRWPGIEVPLYAADAVALVLWSLLRDEGTLQVKKGKV